MTNATPQPLPDPSGALPPARLECLEAGDQRVILINGRPVAQYRRDDGGTERVLVTQLATVLPLADADIARTFGVHPVTLSRWRGQARAGGARALMPARPGPRRASKLTPQLEARIVRLAEEEGLSSRAIAGRLTRGQRTVSHTLVANVLRVHRQAPEPQPLPFVEKLEAVGSEPAPSVPEPAEHRRSRYAGALLLYAALARLDLWGALRTLEASVGPARRFGWRETVAAIVFCFALRFRSVEDSKNARRQDLGVLLGQAEAPGVQTLRLKLGRLAESIEPTALAREMFRRYLALEPVWEGIYYIDGHFCPYYGQHPTPHGWSPQRRLAIKGHTDVYVHDVRGRPLFFLSQPLNDSLVRAVPALVAEIRQVHGEAPFTLVFDRGGYSGKLFRWLGEQGIGFVTYLKGRKARRRLPESTFARGWFSFEGTRHVYRLCERRTQVRPAGRLRTIVYQDDEGEQIPVLTNLDGAVNAAKVVHILRLRWRQENSFKYLAEHYGIDQILQYGASEEAQPRRVANPRRQPLQERVRAVRAEIEGLEAELGRALDGNPESVRRTVRGLKIAQGKLRHRLALRRQSLGRLENRLRHTPATVPAAELGQPPRRALLHEDRRLLIQTLKLAAYNAERLLTRDFQRYYGQAKDVFSIFRGLLHLPGMISVRSADHWEVELQAPRPAKVAAALDLLLEDLNRQNAHFLGDGPRLEFTLAP